MKHPAWLHAAYNDVADWSYADLPKVIDPPTGYIHNTNDPPWVATYPQVIHYKDYPPYIANNGPMSLRAQQRFRAARDQAKVVTVTPERKGGPMAL